MDMDERSDNQPGGFFPQSLPSPAPSHASTSSMTSNLPHPRAKPLRAGSAKEDAARRYVEERLLHVSRRYTKKFQTKEDREEGEMKGYERFGEVARDLGEVVDVIWLSGTRIFYRSQFLQYDELIRETASLQIPYLMNVALSISSYLPAFPPAPRATLALLRKLDHAFSSLLKGEDTVTGEILPGFGGGMRAGMSKTDMVRCKGIVQSTRVMIVNVIGKGLGTEESEVDTDAETETESRMDVDEGTGAEGGLDMDIAKVYESTIELLGEALGRDEIFAP